MIQTSQTAARLRYPIVVCAPSFTETSGGTIVLHYLVDRIRSLGYEAYIFPIIRDLPYSGKSNYFLVGPVIHWLKTKRNTRIKFNAFATHPAMDAPMAPKSILRDAIVVYPEIVSGNPLRSRRVVRWLLAKPGLFGIGGDFGKDDFFFYYGTGVGQEAFDSLNIDRENALRIRWIRDDVYRDLGLPGRRGACRLIRKGRFTGMEQVPDDGSIVIDDLSHEEKAEVFNRTRILYSHDPYTMYCFYAALCGCIPVVLPQEGVSREQWMPDIKNRYGLAYGEQDIEWAISTRDLMIEQFYREKRTEGDTVRRFVEKLAKRFP
jgi:hypothetical protein